MKYLKILRTLVVCVIICNGSHAQNNQPNLTKHVKTVKKHRIKKRLSDSTLTLKQTPLPTTVMPNQKEDGFKKPVEKFRIQKTLFISSNQTESNCAGAFFRHSGLYI
jgi:hypothetical protein